MLHNNRFLKAANKEETKDRNRLVVKECFDWLLVEWCFNIRRASVKRENWIRQESCGDNEK